MTCLLDDCVLVRESCGCLGVLEHVLGGTASYPWFLMVDVSAVGVGQYWQHKGRIEPSWHRDLQPMLRMDSIAKEQGKWHKGSIAKVAVMQRKDWTVMALVRPHKGRLVLGERKLRHMDSRVTD
jgi:hypothetical protein